MKKQQNRKRSSEEGKGKCDEEVKEEINFIIQEVVEKQKAVLGQARTLHWLMKSSLPVFKKNFLELMERIITLDGKEYTIKCLYVLFAQFFTEVIKDPQFGQVSALMYLLDVAYMTLGRSAPIFGRCISLFSEVMLRAVTFERVHFQKEQMERLKKFALKLMANSKGTVQIVGLQLGKRLCQCNTPTEVLQHAILKKMTFSPLPEVRKNAVGCIPAPYSELALVSLLKRLRDKVPAIRKLTFERLLQEDVRLDAFQSKEARMMLVKEGLMDEEEGVRDLCRMFVRRSLDQEDEKELFQVFRLIDAKVAFQNRYFIELPMLLVKLVVEVFEEEKVFEGIRWVLSRMELHFGDGEGAEDMDMACLDKMPLPTFEEILGVRLTFEYLKQTLRFPSPQHNYSRLLDQLDSLVPAFSTYSHICRSLSLDSRLPRCCLSEWLKFSLQLPIEEEMTRQGLIGLMFDLLSNLECSMLDYEHLLKYGRAGVVGQGENEAKELQELQDLEQTMDDQTIEIEVQCFQDLQVRRSVEEYCKPYSYEQYALDFDDCCRVALTVAKRLLMERIEEFSNRTLQTLSDITEGLEDSEEQPSYQTQAKTWMQTFERKIEEYEEMLSSDVSFDSLNTQTKKIKRCVKFMESLHLREKLCYKRALTVCLVLLKNCRPNRNDQNLVALAESMIIPTIQKKDRDNFLLAIECIGLFCLLHQDLFESYSPIFTSILTETVINDNLKEKTISLRASVDAFIIHGVSPRTQKLYSLLTRDYLFSPQKALRQIAVEGVCKVLFSCKVAAEGGRDEGLEALIFKLVVQFFDKKFGWQNSMIRQVLNVFFKSFVLFTAERCTLLFNSLLKVFFCVLKAKYCPPLKKKPAPRYHGRKKKGGSNQRQSSDSNYESNEDSLSEDSSHERKTTKLEALLAGLDPVQIFSVFAVILNRDYILANRVKQFEVAPDFGIDLLVGVLRMNNLHFRKVQAVKEVLVQLADDKLVPVGSIEQLEKLQMLKIELEQMCKMQIQQSGKVQRFQQVVDSRIRSLEQDVLPGVNEAPPLQISLDFPSLEVFFTREVCSVTVDIIKEEEDEVREVSQGQLPRLVDSLKTPKANRRSSALSSSSFSSSGRSQKEERKIITRSQQRKPRLDAISEREEENSHSEVSQRCDTIHEEEEEGSSLWSSKQDRRSLMDTLSKKVFRTYQRARQEDSNERGTVYKLTKAKQPLEEEEKKRVRFDEAEYRASSEGEDLRPKPHNLSVRFNDRASMENDLSFKVKKKGGKTADNSREYVVSSLDEEEEAKGVRTRSRRRASAGSQQDKENFNLNLMGRKKKAREVPAVKGSEGNLKRRAPEVKKVYKASKRN